MTISVQSFVVKRSLVLELVEGGADTQKVFLRYLLNKISSSNFTQCNFNNMHIG